MRNFDIMYFLRRWGVWIIIVAAVAGVAYFGHKTTAKVQTVRLSAGAKGGYYNSFCQILKKHVEKNTDLIIEIIETRGAVENRLRLLRNEADLGLLQNGPLSIENLYLVAPLWDDFIQVIVPKNTPIRHFKELEGKNVTIGKEGSGIRANAEYVLDHYDIELEKLGKKTNHYRTIVTDGSISASMVTTSLLNPSVQKIMQTGRFTLLPLEEAEGISFRQPYLRENTVPVGVFTTIGNPVPERPIKTVSALSMLVSRKDAPPDVIKKILTVLYTLDMKIDASVLLDKDRVIQGISWKLLPVHPASKSFFNPYEGAKRLSEAAELMMNYGWLILAVLIAGVLLIYKLINQRRLRQEYAFEKESRMFRKLLADISRIEQKQKNAKDLRVLKQYLNEAMTIKKQGMETTELSSRIQNSSLYLAFLQECTFVIREIEWKLSLDIAEKGLEGRPN